MRKEGGLMLIGDVTVLPVPKILPPAGSTPAERIRLSTGGDALNEATVAARLGTSVMLITLLGRDDMANVIRAHCQREGIRLLAPEDPQTDTGLNVVLVDERGERRFLTNANGTLRRLSLEHILPFLETDAYAAARAVCLASLFVSPTLTLSDTQALFRRIQADGKLLCADTTRPKNGETLADAAPVLQYLDWFFPNLEEALRLTAEKTPRAAAEALLNAGVKNVAIKLGGEGCLLASRECDFAETSIPADGAANVTQLCETADGAANAAQPYKSADGATNVAQSCEIDRDATTTAQPYKSADSATTTVQAYKSADGATTTAQPRETADGATTTTQPCKSDGNTANRNLVSAAACSAAHGTLVQAKLVSNASAPFSSPNDPSVPVFFRRVPAVPGVRCVDTTGAGDTFAAAFQCALLAGEPPVRCAAFANAVASLCVEQPGATTARFIPDEIARRRDEILARL